MSLNSQFPQLLEYNLGGGVRAFSTMRNSSDETSPYSGFNITHYCGDSPAHVSDNRQLLCEALGIPDSHLILPHQTHSSNVACVDEKMLSLPSDERELATENIDALVTDVRGVCIGVSTADCVPILLYDSSHHAIAAIHAGWRGTAKKIVANTIHRMIANYGTNPSQLRAIIGPSISVEAFEVGDEVYEAFQAAGFPMSHIAKRFPSANKSSKWHIDLWAANVCTLETAGVDLSQIMVSGICTYTHYSRFFSARRLGIHSGRTFSGILLTDKD